MPTYEYECSACGHRLEEFQSMTAKPLKKCPECGKSALSRLIGLGAGVLFKGGGFYETDYRSESYKKAAEAETKAASPSNGEAKGHAHTGSCACGRKPKAECASAPAAGPAPASDKAAPKPSRKPSRG